MADPLEGHLLEAVDQQLNSSSTQGEQIQQPPVADSQASLHGHRKSIHCSREPKKWGRAWRNQHSPENAARERSRVRNLRQAFHSLQAALPSVPPDTKLSKLDVLVLATNYIAYLTEMLDKGVSVADPRFRPGGYLHPVKKWPMRSLLYCGTVGDLSSANQKPPHEENGICPQAPLIQADKQ
ncbi:transcription factor 24 isoform 2-T2 [Menidia menidia]